MGRGGSQAQHGGWASCTCAPQGAPVHLVSRTWESVRGAQEARPGCGHPAVGHRGWVQAPRDDPKHGHLTVTRLAWGGALISQDRQTGGPNRPPGRVPLLLRGQMGEYPRSLVAVCFAAAVVRQAMETLGNRSVWRGISTTCRLWRGRVRPGAQR